MCLWSALAMIGPAPVAGQGQVGTLTVMSRPSGATVSVEGDLTIIAPTPLTLEPGMVGRFRVRSAEPGYERWQRRISFDGVASDTVWMRLTPKSRLKAGVRSLVVPGWGQLYSERPATGWVFLVAGLAGGTASVWAHREYEDRLDELAAVTTVPEFENALAKAEEAYDNRQWIVATTAGIWAVNLLDAMIFYPDFRKRRATQFSLEAPIRGRAIAVAIRARF